MERHLSLPDQLSCTLDLATGTGNELAIDWQNTKTKHSRQIPISPAMWEVLVRRQKAHPADHESQPEHYVFGNEIGGKVKEIRTAWDNAVLKAHGVKVARGHAGRVSAENRAKLREIDLNFHDLRHEAGSRKLEAGWPLHAYHDGLATRS
jgi:integrase